MFAVRKEVLKAALADDETRLKMNLALSLQEIELILTEFARKHGFKVAVLEGSERIKM